MLNVVSICTSYSWSSHWNVRICRGHVCIKVSHISMNSEELNYVLLLSPNSNIFLYSVHGQTYDTWLWLQKTSYFFGAFDKCVCFSRCCGHEIWENNFLSPATPFIFIKLSFKKFSLLQICAKLIAYSPRDINFSRRCCQRFSFLVCHTLSLGE